MEKSPGKSPQQKNSVGKNFYRKTITHTHVQNGRESSAALSSDSALLPVFPSTCVSVIWIKISSVNQEREGVYCVRERDVFLLLTFFQGHVDCLRYQRPPLLEYPFLTLSFLAQCG